ncbi:hypothetical protein DPMN_013800 [Dreissena polymorpha]|uniref:Uncharacterized protein n=1 Tax=Dreissena polymorpha TaxID=45954 RepID=A0A9D4S434_DREPO|nr:hypothetical protein DPMN_013800 [Dreissena polymorpha]
MLSIVCAVLILIGHAPDVTCQTGANVKALKQKLFVTDAYDYKVRPTDNQSEPIGKKY